MDISKYQNIKLTGLIGKWSAIDEYSDGESDYILLECISFRGTPNVLCQVSSTNELHIIEKTDEFKAYTAIEKLTAKGVKI